MMSLSIQATWSRGDIRSKLSGISKAKFKFIELSENDIIDAKEDGEDIKTLLFEYGCRLSIFEIVERRDQYQGYGSKNASARLAAQSNYKQAGRTAYV
tara:strand:+ start:5720 stop:6013 length:294 start_codon:yes stop_codon:yes gene_type:complete